MAASPAPRSAGATIPPAAAGHLPGLSGRLRRDLTAALAVAAVLAHLLFAQAALALVVILLVTGRVTRWRPLWLAVPAAAGAAWAAATGVPAALAGFAAGPRQVAAYLGAAVGHPGRLAHLAAAFSGAGHWLPRQVPVALLAAAAEAAVVSRAIRPPWYRPGLVVVVRRRASARALAGGTAVTREGCAIGLDIASGRLAEITWARAAGGVLMAGADPQAAARAAVPVACAAVRRRMAVVVIDLAGTPWLADALAAECAAAGAPLSRVSPAGPAWYEPFRDHPPARAASLAIRMVSWAGTTERQREAGQRCLADALAVLALSPAPPPVLDGLIALLEPGQLREAVAALPGHLPRRAELEQRVQASAAAIEADPALRAALSGQLERLRASALGRWLRPPPARPSAPPPARIGPVLRDRGCVLFSLGAAGEAAAMAGRLAVADLTAVLAGLREQQLRADCLAWVHGCDGADRSSLAALLKAGPEAGTAVLLSTASPAAAASLAPDSGTVVAVGPVDQGLAERLAGPDAPALQWQDEDEFAIAGPGTPFRPGGRLAPARPGGRA
jgi:hypothetical protein